MPQSLTRTSSSIYSQQAYRGRYAQNLTKVVYASMFLKYLMKRHTFGQSSCSVTYNEHEKVANHDISGKSAISESSSLDYISDLVEVLYEAHLGGPVRLETIHRSQSRNHVFNGCHIIELMIRCAAHVGYLPVKIYTVGEMRRWSYSNQ